MDVTLQVKSVKDRVVLSIGLHNRGSEPIKVPRAIATEKELFSRLFEIKDAASGEPVEYQGIMVKRGPLTEADYVTLKPGARRNNRMDITDSYAFKHKQHKYVLSYAGSYLDGGKEKPLTAAPAAFTHTGK